MIATLKLRRGPAYMWTERNPVLEDGEPGYESNTGRFKIGDGVAAWEDLPYFVDAGGVSSLIALALENLASPFVAIPESEYYLLEEPDESTLYVLLAD